MADVVTTSTPDTTQVVDQTYFLVPLGGPSDPRNYLDRFPDAVYNKGVDSLLVKFMYAALGPAGAGWLRKNHLQARLLLEDFGLETFDLDKFYGNPLGFGRIFEEAYDDDTTGLVSPEKWKEIKAKDASYRNRASDFVSGARAGNTPLGIRLISRSGLGHDVDIVEQYRYLYDQISDEPLGLSNYGHTNSMSEFVVVPKREISPTETQVLTVTGDPTSGTLAISYPATTSDAAGTVYVNYNASARNGWLTKTTSATTANTLPTLSDLDNTDSLVVGMGVSGTNIPAGTTVSAIIDGTSITMSANATGSAAITATFTSSAWTGVKEALESIPQIGPSNTIVEGGRLPANPIKITFTKKLGFKDVPSLTVLNQTSGPLATTAVFTTERNGNDASNEIVSIGPREQHHLFTALDKIRPVTSIPTFNLGRGTTIHQLWDTAQATSEFKEIVRYVTGQPLVNWPTTDNHWIRQGAEKQAPRSSDSPRQHYVGFHNISGIDAYIDTATTDINYLTASWSTIKDSYVSRKIGRFTPYQEALYPALLANDIDHDADDAPADYAEPIFVTSTTADPNNPIALINGIYPSDYASLEGVPGIKYTQEQFWASSERPTGDDYIEIDLGKVCPVNYIYFETTRKPINIAISYDLLDQAPARSWAPAHDIPGLPSTSSISFDLTSVNPWVPIEYYFTNSLGGIPFTRFIRIKLSRRIEPNSPFVTSDGETLPSSIEVKNLRVARNVN